MEGNAATTRTRLDVLAVLLAVHVDLSLAPHTLDDVPGSTPAVATPEPVKHGLSFFADVAFAGEVTLIEVDGHGVTIERSPCCNKNARAQLLQRHPVQQRLSFGYNNEIIEALSGAQIPVRPIVIVVLDRERDALDRLAAFVAGHLRRRRRLVVDLRLRVARFLTLRP